MGFAARSTLALLASAALLALYAQGVWALGFIALLPCLCLLDATRSAWRVLLLGWLMSVTFTAAGFAWFGLSLGDYLQLGAVPGLVLLLVLAPVFQPQVLVFALLRHAARQRLGQGGAALCGAAAWVATEWAWPKLLGDTLGHGLYPSALLRQAAELGGAAGLTFLLLLAHEGLAAAVARRRDGLRALAPPLAGAAAVPLLLAAFGLALPDEPPLPPGQGVRLGLVQSNIVDYERLRREKGAGEVVREVLDLHFAMSHDAVERQKAQALLWSETVYPTTFGSPKSEAGAEFDREIQAFVNAAGVPLVFGTYERDAGGEYNVAAFVEPGRGLLGFYRKTRLFPFTESLPAWLDSPALRSLLPGAGAWRPGSGARVFPLRLRDGRELPVLPLICLDDVDPGLAIDGARLGATLILTMSNDSWFTAWPLGAQLHLAVAAFRSIETRLPQFRVTHDGYSAVIDARGQVLAGSVHGQRTLVVGDLPVREPRRTLMVAWGDWVGRTAAGALLLLGAVLAWRAWGGPGSAPPDGRLALPPQVAVLTPAVRGLTAMLIGLAGCSLLAMGAAVLRGEGALASNTLAQLRAFAALVLVPQAVAWGLVRATTAALSIDGGRLQLSRGAGRRVLALDDIVALQPWRLALPAPGCTLALRDGSRLGLAGLDARALNQARVHAGAAPLPIAPAWAAALGPATLASRPGSWLQRPAVKFVVLPLLLALPAFRLHQHIAFGSPLGELHSFGALAFAQAFGLWWGAWIVGVCVVAAVLRVVVEALMLGAALARPAVALPRLRRGLEALALLLLYGGLPAWLAWRALSG